jgi:hypothetical protein
MPKSKNENAPRLAVGRRSLIYSNGLASDREVANNTAAPKVKPPLRPDLLAREGRARARLPANSPRLKPSLPKLPAGWEG